MKSVLSIFALLCFVSLFSGTKQEILYGHTCSEYRVSALRGFSTRLYGGKWYVYGLSDYEKSLNQDCMVWDHQNITSPYANAIETSVDRESNIPKRIDSTIFFDQRGRGQYTYIVPTDTEVVEYVKVISTDYERYAIEWSCEDYPEDNHCEFYVYLMTREPEPDQETIDIMEGVCRKHNIDLSNTRLVDHGQDICGSYE